GLEQIIQGTLAVAVDKTLNLLRGVGGIRVDRRILKPATEAQRAEFRQRDTVGQGQTQGGGVEAGAAADQTPRFLIITRERATDAGLRRIRVGPARAVDLGDAAVVETQADAVPGAEKI